MKVVRGDGLVTGGDGVYLFYGGSYTTDKLGLAEIYDSQPRRVEPVDRICASVGYALASWPDGSRWVHRPIIGS